MSRWWNAVSVTAGAETWELAVRRAAVIGPLAEKGTVGLAAADAVAAELGISRRQVYELVRRWRAGEAWLRTCCRAAPAAGAAAGGFRMR